MLICYEFSNRKYPSKHIGTTPEEDKHEPTMISHILIVITWILLDKLFLNRPLFVLWGIDANHHA